MVAGNAPVGPQLKLTGKEAMQAVAKILPTSHDVTVNSSLGIVTLKPGTIWSGNRLLFEAGITYVRYAIDDRIYEWNTSDFIRTEWFDALSKGASTAKGWITVAKAEFALLSGIFCPWYMMLGLSCAKVGLFYTSHKREVDAAFKYAPKVIELLGDLKKRSPTLYSKLVNTWMKETLVNLPSGVTAEDVSFFVGRVIKGAAGAGPDLVFGTLLKVMGKVAAIVTATHLPSIAGHALANVASAKAKELQTQLRAVGFTVTESEARTILADLLSKRDTIEKLRGLDLACRAMLPSLQALNLAYATTQ
jgi:hypothetical protein